MRDWKFVCLILVILSLPSYIYLAQEINIFGLNEALWLNFNRYIAIPIILMLELIIAGLVTHKDQKHMAMGISLVVTLPILIILSLLL